MQSPRNMFKICIHVFQFSFVGSNFFTNNKKIFSLKIAFLYFFNTCLAHLYLKGDSPLS